MKINKYDIDHKRRAMLSGAGAVTAGAVVAVAMPASAVAATTAETETQRDTLQDGYHLSEHVLRYYRNASR